jgi:hypothetical protein
VAMGDEQSASSRIEAGSFRGTCLYLKQAGQPTLFL